MLPMIPAYRSGPFVFIVLVALVALASWSLYHSIKLIIERPADFGWDVKVVCGALSALLNGLNPYIRENLGGSPFSFVYLPHAALLSSPICIAPIETLTYAWLSLAVFIVSMAFLLRKLGCDWLETALLALIAPGIFASFEWIVITGNPSVVNLPFLAGAVISFLRRRYALSGILLGAMASIKLVPVLGLLAYFVALPLSGALMAFGVGLATFLIILLANVVAMGDAGATLLELLMRSTPGNSVSAENTGKLSEGWADPNVVDFLLNLLDRFGINHRTLLTTILAVFALLLGTAIQRVRSAASGRPNNLFATKLFCFALMTLTLFLFRLKPYAYSDLAPLVLVCCIGLPIGLSLFVLAIGCILPPVLGLYDRSNVFVMYAQTTSFIATFAVLSVLLIWEAYFRRHTETSGPSAINV